MKNISVLILCLFLTLTQHLCAEDDGFFINVGYQIGEAEQNTQNSGAIQKLNNRFLDLQNTLVRFNALNTQVANGSSNEVIQKAIDSLLSFNESNSDYKSKSSIWNLVENARFNSLLNIIGSYAYCMDGIVGNKNTNGNCSVSIAKIESNQPLSPFNEQIYYLHDNTEIPSQKMANEVAHAYLTIHRPPTPTPTYLSSLSSWLDQVQALEHLIVSNGAWTMDANNDSQSACITYDVWEGPTCNSAWGHDVPKQERVLIDTTSDFQTFKTMIDNTKQYLEISQELNTLADTLQKDRAHLSQANIAEFAQAIKKEHQLLMLAKFIPFQNSEWNDDYSNYETATKNIINYYVAQNAHDAQVAVDILNLDNNKNALNHFLNLANSQGLALSHNKLNLNDIATKTPNYDSPGYTYAINANKQMALTNAINAMSANPFRHLGLIKSRINNGAMNGFGVMLGYKQFFGKKKWFGARYYGFFDYNYAYIKSGFFNSASNVLTYGFGTDLLFNFINDKKVNRAKSKLSFGVFTGIQLAGTSWLNNNYAILENHPVFNGQPPLIKHMSIPPISNSCSTLG
ncbi:outer membrane protein [Helicobacter cetorum]|uniref:Outer membrane protein HopP n=1 Tax=Helicobacter cetorum (strain ATCC BAA-429 / MIT 00-7128) TaxID=182217 RepID=I0EM96_HELC0|nr:outer membrane protein [Helicobacter cetorum]AFI04065.1 outer membrane protein HopP [Helicobacter cetorum MIT 00-7128]